MIYCHPELIQPRIAKQIFPQQWHLKATNIDGVSVNAHANIEDAAQPTTGNLATIAIIDDGVDIDHLEFAIPGKVVAPRDATLRTDDPRPKSSRDRHGTACAGVACAAGVNGASRSSQRQVNAYSSCIRLGSINEADAFKHAADNGAVMLFHVVGVQRTAIGSIPAIHFTIMSNRFRRALETHLSITTQDAVAKDALCSSPLAMAANPSTTMAMRVPARRCGCGLQRYFSTQCVYSDFGKAVWCCFPSNDFGDAGLQQPNPLTTGI